MKEVYVYREDGDTFATLSKKIDDAAREVDIISLSSKKRRMLLSELSKKSSVVVCSVEPKLHKKDTTTNIEVTDSTLLRLVAKKIGKGFSSYNKVIADCLDKLDAIEKMIDDCSCDEAESGTLYGSLYDLFNGEKSLNTSSAPTSTKEYKKEVFDFPEDFKKCFEPFLKKDKNDLFNGGK